MDNIGAVFILRSDRSALFQLRDNDPGICHAGMWVPPGGHQEPGESIIDCARRDVLEETTLRCDELYSLTSFIDHVKGWEPRYLHVFWTIYCKDQFVQCNEGVELKFIQRQEAKNYDIPEYLLDLWDLALQAYNEVKREGK